jgi:A/G-specific adenine glycosylase
MNKIHNLIRNWHENNKRDLPWKMTSDPYKIWIREIILQQTRVEQGGQYYQRFIKQFPNVSALANASEDEVLLLWQGLGYYSRARNLHKSAKQVVHLYNGVFPSDFDELMQLKGVGNYTASAIMSFAYKKPFVAIDGNLLRIVTRMMDMHQPIDQKSTIDTVRNIATSWLDKKDSATFNQAMMDLGATICTPKNYKCDICPFGEICLASKNKTQAMIPFKSKKLIKVNRYFHYFVLKSNHQVMIQRREGNDIWQGLYQFPMIEKSTIENIQVKAITEELGRQGIKNTKIKLIEIIDYGKMVLTHQNIFIKFYIIESSAIESLNFDLVLQKNILKFAYPKTLKEFIVRYLK